MPAPRSQNVEPPRRPRSAVVRALALLAPLAALCLAVRACADSEKHAIATARREADPADAASDAGPGGPETDASGGGGGGGLFDEEADYFSLRRVAATLPIDDEARLMRLLERYGGAPGKSDVGRSSRLVRSLERLLRDDSPAIRAAAVALLGRMSPRDAPDAVFSMAFSDADARVRVEIVRALAVRGPAERADRLLAAAEDRDERVRKAAVVALGRVATPESRAVLLRSLADADGDVVRAAGGSLAHTLKEMPPELVAAASSERAIVRIASSQALAALGAKESLSALRKLSADPVDEVRREAIRGLGTLGEPHAAAAKGELERIAASGARSRTDRFEAIQSLAEGPLTPDAEILVRVTRDDEDPLLRVAAARTLVGRGDVRGIPVLVALVEPATQDGQPVGDDEARALAVSAASETLRAVAGAVPQSGEPTAWTSALPQLQAIVARPGFEYVPSRLAEPR